MTGYGRTLASPAEERPVIEAALGAVSGIQFGIAHGDLEVVESGRRNLARVRAQALLPTGEPHHDPCP